MRGATSRWGGWVALIAGGHPGTGAAGTTSFKGVYIWCQIPLISTV